MYVSPSEGSPFIYNLKTGFNSWCTPYKLNVSLAKGATMSSGDEVVTDLNIKADIDAVSYTHLDVYKRQVEIHQNPVHCVDMVYDLTINSLIESKKHINIHEIDRLCDIIYDAKKLHFFGFQFNKILASDIQFKLVKLGKFSYAFADRGDDSQRIELLDERCV